MESLAFSILSLGLTLFLHHPLEPVATVAQEYELERPYIAHGGGLNADGCHNDLRTGGYHCHRPTGPDRPPTHCGSSEADLGPLPDDWSSYSCQAVGGGGCGGDDREDVCLTPSEYTSQTARGCPGPLLCCPPL